jgi:small subunit ribosomal protein S5
MINDLNKTNKFKTNKLKSNSRRRTNLQELKLVERLIKISRVSKVTKGGKKLSFRAIVVVGDQKGKVGVGVAKANDVGNAFKKAKTNGRKNLIKFPITKSSSIPHNVTANFGACKIIMRPSIEGSGVIAGGAVRIVLEVAGVKNVIAKQLGSNNLLNNARASICALQNLTTKFQILKKRNLNSTL